MQKLFSCVISQAESDDNVLVRMASSALLGIDKCVSDIDNAFKCLTNSYQLVSSTRT